MPEAENSPPEISDIQRYAMLEDTAAAVEAERRRLAGLLQGSVIEPLNLLLAQAHVYEQTLGQVPQARMAVSVLASLAWQALQQARDLEANLHPAILESLGLEAALETLVSQETRAHNIPIKLVMSHVPERLPAPVELALFRATQDALNYTILQAHASQISIRLECQTEWLILGLMDNGFLPDEGRPALPSRQRIEGLGGTIEARNDAQTGSQLYIYFPMKAAVEMTPREMEVIQRLAEGLSNKQIAKALGVSARTINFHLDNIYSKLSVNTRTEAVVFALRQGWITG